MRRNPEMEAALETLLDTEISGSVLWDASIQHFRLTGEQIDTYQLMAFLARAHVISQGLHEE